MRPNVIRKQSENQSDNLDIIWEACDINKISPLELENPDFIHSIDKYMNDHDLLEILGNDEIIFLIQKCLRLFTMLSNLEIKKMSCVLL